MSTVPTCRNFNAPHNCLEKPRSHCRPLQWAHFHTPWAGFRHSWRQRPSCSLQAPSPPLPSPVPPANHHPQFIIAQTPIHTHHTHKQKNETKQIHVGLKVWCATIVHARTWPEHMRWTAALSMGRILGVPLLATIANSPSKKTKKNCSPLLGP